MMTQAELWELRPQGSNPCRNLRRYKMKPRERFLSLDELERLGFVLDRAEGAQAAVIARAMGYQAELPALPDETDGAGGRGEPAQPTPLDRLDGKPGAIENVQLLHLALSLPFGGTGKVPKWQGLGLVGGGANPSAVDAWNPVENIDVIQVAQRETTTDLVSRATVRFLQDSANSGERIGIEVLLPAATAREGKRHRRYGSRGMCWCGRAECLTVAHRHVGYRAHVVQVGVEVERLLGAGFRMKQRPRPRVERPQVDVQRTAALAGFRADRVHGAFPQRDHLRGTNDAAGREPCPVAGAPVEPVPLASFEHSDNRAHRVIVRRLQVSRFGLHDGHGHRVVFEQGPIATEQETAATASVDGFERRQGDDAGRKCPHRFAHHRTGRGHRVTRRRRIAALAHELPGIEQRGHDEATVPEWGRTGC